MLERESIALSALLTAFAVIALACWHPANRHSSVHPRLPTGIRPCWNLLELSGFRLSRLCRQAYITTITKEADCDSDQPPDNCTFIVLDWVE